MRNKLRRCSLPLLAAVGILPVVALLAWGVGRPRLMLWVPVYGLCSCLCAQLRGKWRLGTAVGMALCMAAVGVAGAIRARELAFLLTGVGHGILLLATLPARETLPQEAVFTGLLIHVAAQLWLHAMDGTAMQSTYAPAKPLVTAAFVVFLACAMVILNGVSLASAMPEKQAIPSSIRRRNRLLTFLMLLAALLIGLIPALSRWLAMGWALLRTVIGKLILWLISLYPDQTPVTGGGDGGAAASGMLGAEASASPLAVILEKILLVLALLLMLALLLQALRLLYRKLKQLVRWLLQRLQSYAALATEDYVDELQATRTQGEERFSLRRLRRRRISVRELDAMPPRERIRCRYAIARTKHPEWPLSGTARETLQEDSARIYERARYSSHPVTEEDAGCFTT